MNKIHAAFILRLAILSAFVWGAGSSLAASPLTIYTVNYPLAYFAQSLGGDAVDVVFPLPAEVDPAFWQPESEVIRQYQQADLILLNGASYAKWTKRVSLPRLRSADTSAAFREQLISSQDGVSHSHGSGEEHAHTGIAFTTWLDLSQAAMQAEAIARVLKQKLPDQEKIIDENQQALDSQLMDLDRRLGEVVVHNPGLPVLASHPVYQYLARRYGMNLESVLWEPDSVPTEEQWQALQVLLASHDAKWMIWESEPAPETITGLSKLGISSIVFSPVSNRPSQGDFMSVMTRNVENLQTVYGAAADVRHSGAGKN